MESSGNDRRAARRWILGAALAVAALAVLPGCDLQESSDTERGEQLFIQNCGSCHALAAAGTNSGVFLRINGAPKPLPRCIENQLKSGDAGDLYGFHGMKIDGDKARRIEVKAHELGGDFVGVKKLLGNEKPPGAWNRLEVLADGERAAGEVVADLG